MIDRANELRRLCSSLDDAARVTTDLLIDDIVYLEGQLVELKKYPFIKVNPKDPSQQRATPAAKQYKELLQQYNNCIKIMLGVLGKIETAETSPLREYLQRLKGGKGLNC